MRTGPGTVALVDRRGESTYAELDGRVARLRGALAERGVRRGDAVLVVAANERESAIAYHAVVGSGATAVLSHVGAGASELDVAVRGTEPVLTLLSPHAEPTTDGVPITALDGPPAPPVDVDPDAPRLIVFTSGTTSTPKGVIHSARSLAAGVACFRAMLDLGPHDRIFMVSPMASITGVLQSLELAPSVGAAAVLEDDFDDDRTLDLLLATGGTAYGGPDLVLDRLLAAAARRGVGVPLRVAALGGTMLRRELLDTAERDFGVRVVRVYGSSEAPCSSGTRPDEPSELRLRDEGTPGPEVELRIGDGGELLVRGPHLFRGYVGEPPPADWFATGDEAELAEGRLRIVGRLKDVVSRNGKKVSLAEVDQAFSTASGVTECAAFGVDDPATGERVALAVRLDDDVALDVPAVLAAMERGGLARWKLPESVVRVRERLPLTATGKVQRRALREDGEVLWRAPRLASP